MSRTHWLVATSVLCRAQRTPDLAHACSHVATGAGPDMCQISWRNPLSKWGGILERDVIPRMCREDERYEEIVRYGNGVANGGIWKIWAVYYSNGRCDTREVDYKITVHMGGKLVDTFSDTLRKEGDVGTMYNVLGFRSHPTRKHSCARREVRPSKRPRGRKGGRSLLSTRKTERKCVCFHGKTVRHRGECVMPST